MPNKSHIQPTDPQSITRLITEATIAITDLVEAMHKRVVHPPFLPSTPIQHMISEIAGFTFSGVRTVTRMVGGGLDKAFGQIGIAMDNSASSEEREVFVAVLNGVIGDHLVATDNALAIPMQMRHNGQQLLADRNTIEASIPNVNGKILLMVHGVCMTDAQWTRKEHNHGEKLAKERGLTPVYLFYNGGQSIATNGEQLNAMLEELVAAWPVPVKEITILAHSMGGLVARSSIHFAEKENKNWLPYLKKIFFLGTPHHGAPLERAGSYVDIILEATPYAKPFARLGKIRSAGITDLRFGDATALPTHVACYAIAATSSKQNNKTLSSLAGDGLVPVDSALGRHTNATKQLIFPEKNMMILYEAGHLDLLNRDEVFEQIIKW